MNDRRNLLQDSLAAIERLQARLDASEQRLHEPIAIVGAGCRYPGGIEDPEALWRVVRDGIDAVSEIPSDRWNADAFYDPNPAAAGKMVTKRGGFLSQVDRFDPQFFGISPREAATMDPQQRLLLETASEALESAGIAGDRLAGSATGVFVGITTSDYGQLLRRGGPENSDVYAATGSALNAAAGRLSFTFGFQGPCVALDTACSSSLVAVHLACQSLRTRESDLALAGGVNVILSPDAMVLFSKWGMMAPDGACKTFDASADGFVRSEGCAVIALKRLGDAVAAGDPILAVIRGSAVNSDGRSSGLTVPNGPAQQAVLRKALLSAALKPGDLDYVEAHGTGTSLGDPIEVEALGAVLGEGRSPERPLLIGSIKTNIGHAEASSGLAGLLKVVMALRHEAIPPHLHFARPSPAIPWADLCVSVPVELTPWPRGVRPRRAGVSSFGFSGTNAHVILEEAPTRTPGRRLEDGTPILLPLSARDDAALRALAGRYARLLEAEPDATLHDLAFTAATGRTHLLRRLALTADSREALGQDLRSFAAGVLPPSASEGTIRPGARPKIAFVFTGQGAQYAGMGRGLYEREPVFRAILDRAAGILVPYLELPLLDVIFPADASESVLGETGYTQPALFALEYALAELWRSRGITPSVVLGHSVGEYVAACVAGVFTFEEGLKLVAERGRLMQALPAGGGMAAVFADEATVAQRIAAVCAKVAIAAINGPEETVLSGDARALQSVLAACAADGIDSRLLEVSHAFHSPLLDPMLDALERCAGAVMHATPRIPLVSNLTGAPFAPGSGPDARYWCRHAREPVRFAASLEALRATGVNVLVEVGPHPTLLALAARAMPDATWSSIASLRRGRDDRREMLAALGALYVRGAAVQWEVLAPDGLARRMALPTYPFQRERHWTSAPSAPRSVAETGSHALLGRRQQSPAAGQQFLAAIGQETHPFLADHDVLGKVLLPGTAFVEIGLAAARAAGITGPISLRDFAIDAPLELPQGEERLIHTWVEPAGEAAWRFTARSMAASESAERQSWRVHAKGLLTGAALKADDQGAPVVARARERCLTVVETGGYYDRLERAGLRYGPSFRGLRELRVGVRESVGLLVLELPAVDRSQWLVHPALLDAAFHLVGAALLASHPDADPEQVYLPIAIDEVLVNRQASSRVWASARLREAVAGASLVVADLRLEDEAGELLATVRGLQLRCATGETLRRALALPGIATRSHVQRWVPAMLPQNAAMTQAGTYVIVPDRSGVATALIAALARDGASCTIISEADVAANTVDQLSARIGAEARSPAWIIDCASLDLTAQDDPTTAAYSGYARLLRVAQAIAAAAPAAGLCLLTRGAQAIAPGDEVSLAQSALLGLARTVGAERPEAPALRIDLDPATPPDIGPILVALESAGFLEPELGIRNGSVHAPRLVEVEVETAGQLPGSPSRRVLKVRERGAVDGLQIETAQRRPPGPGEVEIGIRAAGLNFRDVLNVLGMYPGDAGTLGSECSGTVLAVGPDVKGLAPGDEVVALATDSLATHVTVSAKLVVRKPANLGFADAVTLPNTYLTAAQALLVAAGLQAGQRVLIHAAAGGVGLAALRLARRAGAEVIATAGSDEKRAFALAEGASHAFDSRSGSFADEILAVTGGRGVDVVLNSLSGELVGAGMRVLRPGGCFVEIGKKGIWTHEEAARQAPGVRYEIVDLGKAIDDDLGAVRSMFEKLLRDVAAGVLAPLPVRAFPLADAVAAFRHMAMARHIGKVVLIPAEETAADPALLSLRPDATYLVTGGLGGLGFATARLLAQRGARELVLVGRRSPGAAEEALLDQLRAIGTRVTAVACDIGDEQAVRSLWRDVLAERPALRGIVHAAGVLSDARLGEQDATRFDAVAHGKLRGAWHLHKLSSGTPLDFFALFSSSSAVLGSPGQANYASANAFLDGLAHYRRGRGLPATSLAWGAWADVGMAARMPEAQRARWARAGIGFLDPADALAALERALVEQRSYVAIVALDRSRIVAHAGPAVCALLDTRADARTGAAAAEPVAAAGEVLKALRATQGGDAAALHEPLRKYVLQEAARVLGFNPSALDAETPLSALGFDSLMAVQLKNRIEADLALGVSLAKLLSGSTIAQLTLDIGEALADGTADVSKPEAVAAGAWEEGSL